MNLYNKAQKYDKDGKRIRVTDLCIFVDKNVYDNPDVDHNAIFDAIYNIVLAIALKHRIFQNWEDYEPYALYAAGRVYFRYTNKRQFLEDGNPRKLEKIKSVLNYVNKTMDFMRVDYQHAYFAENYCVEGPEKIADAMEHTLRTSAMTQSKPFLQIEFGAFGENIKNTVKQFVETTPYASVPLLKHNLYVSCLMTLCNQFTLSNVSKRRLECRMKTGYNVDGFLDNVYSEEVERSVVCYNLDSSMEGYIKVCVNRIKRLVCKDMKELISAHDTPDSVVQAIMSSSYEGIVSNDSE